MKKLVLLVMMGIIFVIGCGKNTKIEKENNNTVKETGFPIKTTAGTEIPTFTLTDLDGKTYDSKKLMDNGKKTLFVMAAEWCPHCKNEMPSIQQFYDENKEKVNIVVIFTHANSSLDAVKKYITENGYTIPAYYDADGSVLNGLGVQGFPFNIKVDGTKIEKTLELPVDYGKLASEFAQ